ncbi:MULTISPECIES: MFS transporter [Bacillus]|uniref:MFS transporter n=1 Tax=Bacillus albus TaxID=2026189 RepID=UPI00141A0FA4|nr:MFS transporter [Bacillus albus]
MNEIASLWGNRIYVRMFSAFSISIFGVYLDMIAVATLVSYTWKSDPIIISLIPIAYALPMILFGSWAGVLSDRLKKLRIMIIADVLIAIVTFILVFVPNVYWLLLLLAVRSTFASFFQPAHQALTKQVVHEHHLAQATSWNGLMDQVGRIAGPLLGAMLITGLSPQISMSVRGVSSLCSAFILLSISKMVKDKKQFEQIQKKERQGFFSAWLEGWKYVWNRKIIFYTMFYGLCGVGILQLVESQVPVLMRELFPNSPEMVGWINAIVGLGGVCGVWLIKRIGELKYGWFLGGGIALIGLGFGSLGLFTETTPIFFTFVIGFIAGIGSGLFFISFNIILQKETDIETAGRVFGIQSSLSNLMFIVPPLIGGVFVKLIGVSQVYVWIGSAMFLLGGIGIIFRNKIWKTEMVVEKVKQVTSL